MNLTDQLLGKKYPIKNENNEVVGFKTITFAKFAEDVAGVIIGLDNKEPHNVISPKLAFDILEMEQNKENVNE